MNESNGHLYIDDGPVERALADYFARLDCGAPVDINEIISGNPGCEAGLREFLRQERHLHQAVASATMAGTATENLTGRTLGDFQLERMIGRGGMGVVWKAVQVSLGRQVAVKLLPAALCSDPRHRTRFQNEAKILAQLEHPNIVSVIAVGEESDTYYLAMQYVDGITVDELILLWSTDEHRRAAETPIENALSDTNGDGPTGRASGLGNGRRFFWVLAGARGRERYRLCARIVAEVADGLAHAHECGVLHRDVKPSNILLDHAGVARLTDFGLARMCGDATLTASGTILGTLRYASPEQLRGAPAAIDARSDIYSLGVTLWELVTGKRLIAGEDRQSIISGVLSREAPRTSSLDAQVPRDLDTVIARALAKEPADRYGSAQALADDLRRFLGGRPVEAKPISAIERTFRWANRNRALAASAIGALCVLAGVAALASILVWRANTRTAAALRMSRLSEEQARRNAVAADASERKTRELYYAADIALAGAAWHKHDFAHVRTILDRYAQPKTGVGGSPDDDLRGFEWYFLDRQIGLRSDLVYENKEPLYVIQFMPGGGEFLTAGKDSIVRWHNSTTGEITRSLDTQQLEVNCVSYNPSRRQFATAGDDGTVKIWSAADLSLIHSVKALGGKCIWAKFLDDAELVAGGFAPSHQLIDATTGQLVRDYTASEATLADVELPRSWNAHISKSADHFWTTANSGNGTYRGIYQWNVETGEARRFSTDLTLCNVLMDDSEKFLIINTNLEVRVLEAETGDEVWSYRSENQLEAIALSPDQRRLVVSDRTGQIYLWDIDLSNQAKITPIDNPRKYRIHNCVIYSIAFAADGKALFSAARDGTVRRTILNPKEPYREVTSSFKDPNPLKLSGTDRLAAFPNEPLRFNAPAMRSFSLLRYPPSADISAETLVAGTANGQLGVMKLATGELVCKVGYAPTATRTMDFSPDRSLLAVCSDHETIGRIELLDLRTGRFDRFSTPGVVPGWAYFCSDGSLIAWLTDPGSLICWNVRDRTVRWTSKPEAPCSCAAISPDRKTLITAHDQDVTLIDCATGGVRHRAKWEHQIGTIAFLTDGRSFVVAGVDGQLSVWHTSTGQHLFEIADIGMPIGSDIQPLHNGFLMSTERDKDGRKERAWLEF
jgi:serine/threonine protein kinase/WD40 repeat protein